MDTARSQGKAWPLTHTFHNTSPFPEGVQNKPCLICPLLDGQEEGGLAVTTDYPGLRAAPSGVASPERLSAVSQTRHANTSRLVRRRVTARCGGHVKDRAHSEELDMCLMSCAQRTGDMHTTGFKRILLFAGLIFFFFFLPAIRMQADELCCGIFCFILFFPPAALVHFFFFY